MMNTKVGQSVSLEDSGHDLEDNSKLNVAKIEMNDSDGLSNTTENENKLLHSSFSTKNIENKASGLELSIDINESSKADEEMKLNDSSESLGSSSFSHSIVNLL